MGFTSKSNEMLIFVLFLPFIATALGATTTYTSNTVVTSSAYYPADTSVVVAPGMYLAFDNKNRQILNNFYGPVTVNGELYIGDTGTNTGMSVYFNSDFTNNGNVVLNAINETSAPSFYFQGSSSNFLNNGNLFMVGIGNTGGVTMNVWSGGTVVNNGVITYYQSVA